ncbi:uncharacterized protein LOC142545925 isoform X1 [Primulina tabacum]|uniref:uncharacterized protein LOC142545925 isoform X1 n=2 Tax=Primulina tabacum TaxID=48773 RepID=UPI003F598A73
MSRCFPYPPPGYTLSRSSEDALIESIKLQKERVKAKEQRKEMRKVKKERRKEEDKRKERKDKANPNKNSDKYDISKGQCDKNFWASIDHLEKSGLTDECEQPICLRIPSTSSDSTENSTKRKREFFPVDCRHDHGNVIRTQMASKEQNYSNSSVEHICSTSGRTDIPAQNKDGIGHESKQEAIETSKFGQSFTAKAEKEEIICLISKIDAGAPGITGTSSVPDAVWSSIQNGNQSITSYSIHGFLHSLRIHVLTQVILIGSSVATINATRPRKG